MAAVVAPVLHKYEVPEAAVIVVPPPAQKLKLPEILATAAGFAVTVAELVEVQPFASVVVAVYVPPVETMIEGVVWPFDHINWYGIWIEVNETVTVPLPPGQKDVFPEMAVTGSAFTETVAEVDAVQPSAFVTTTV